MPTKKLKIVQIASEVTPFSKTGGLADVAGSLPKALKKMGHEVIVITPLYGLIDKEKHRLKLKFANVEIYLNSEDKVVINYWRGYLKKNLPVYFIDHAAYFSGRKNMYISTHENARFLVFDVAALKLISLLKFEADIIHCHDWHTGLIPFYLKTDFRYSRTLRKAKTVFTIHNLTFQFGHNWWEAPARKKDYGRGRIPHLFNPRLEFVNFAKRAILSADAINTVSEQYCQEIMTKRFGQDLHRILVNRQDHLYGIVNGIDEKEYNPANDPGLFYNYDRHSLEQKAKNKTELQKMFALQTGRQIPLVGMVTRIAEQKGFDLLFSALDNIMGLGLELVIMGDGDKELVAKIKQAMKKYPRRLGAHLEFNVQDATKVYAGADMFLMPSRVEPCGITQLIAMRYGAIPIVRHIGGLVDTVVDYNPRLKKGNGFVFNKYDARDLLVAVTRAVENYKHEAVWAELEQKVMRASYSWDIPAKNYVTLYRKAMRNNRARAVKE